jgi:hypothetical protein
MQCSRLGSSREVRRYPTLTVIRVLVGLMALGAAAVPGTLSAQSSKSVRLTGSIEERRLDVRPDSTGRLLGLIQGNSSLVQDMQILQGLLPERRSALDVCFRARDRDGTYAADGKLEAPVGPAAAVPVAVAGFPNVAKQKSLTLSRPDDLAMLFVAAPCTDRRSRAFPATFGSDASVLTATLNLGHISEVPEAKLSANGRDLPGTCTSVKGKSVSFNVICKFQLPTGFNGGEQTLVVDFKPLRGPGTVSEFAIWVAGTRQ